jgi:hypothetical protein
VAPYFPGGLDDFVALIIPELQRRGLYRMRYEGPTLRDNLGLKLPVSRVADQCRQTATIHEQVNAQVPSFG